MCIIAYIKPNQQITDQTIRIMFRGNSDGAGIMYQQSRKHNPRIIKGFMNVEELIKAFRSIPEHFERAIHCRIATAGKVSIQCCHPFPVRDMADNMMQAKDESPIAYMHNGVINWCNPKEGMKSPYSDTMLFGKYVLYPVRNQLDNDGVRRLIEHAINGSRLLVFRRGGAPIMFGDWQKDSNGVMYSNGNYKEYTYKTKYAGGCYNDSWYGYSYAGSKTTTATKKESVKSTVPYDCEWDCDNCTHYECEYNNYLRIIDSGISVLVPREEELRAYKAIEDTLFDNGYDITYWETLDTPEDEVSELYIEVEGMKAFPKTISDIAGYEVAGVWAN